MGTIKEFLFICAHGTGLLNDCNWTMWKKYESGILRVYSAPTKQTENWRSALLDCYYDGLSGFLPLLLSTLCVCTFVCLSVCTCVQECVFFVEYSGRTKWFYNYCRMLNHSRVFQMILRSPRLNDLYRRQHFAVCLLFIDKGCLKY